MTGQINGVMLCQAGARDGHTRTRGVRLALCSLAILVVTCARVSAQTEATGTWRADGLGWTVFLRMEGFRLVGLVSHCATVFPQPVEIYDTNVTEHTVTFKCLSADRDRTMAFTGKRSGDAIVFSWEKRVREGGLDNTAVDRIFGPSAAREFTTRRVPDGDLAKVANRVRGLEFAAAVNLALKDTKAEGLIFLPRSVSRVRVVIVVIRYGLGFSLYNDPEWRKLAESLDGALLSVQFSSVVEREGALASVNWADGGSDALSSLLHRVAEESGHAEVSNAPLVIWGHSGGGGVASILAGLRPERTVAFVRYHSGPVSGDLAVVRQVPALLLAGGRDTTASVRTAEALWKEGRSLAAPWTFAVEPEATHGDDKDLAKANALVIPWITAVARLRLSADGIGLRVITDASAWMGDHRTGQVASQGTFTAAKPEASWLPDEPSALAWQALHPPVK